jgi:glycosyltransferase involved in cell wall biosynthesis
VTPRFTVLLAINRPPVFLPCAVESVLAQTVKEFELFIVCDGAPVETIDCAREQAGRDPRIKALVFPKGERIGEAHLHDALRVASGRYVAHIEDDDLWFPTHLEELERLLQTADFGHLMHVWAKPDESIEMLPSNLAIPEFRQRMLDEKFNRFGLSVCGYRLDAYRRLTGGWAPGQKGLWPDLNMWRKFLRRDDLEFGTRMAVTAVVLASGFRTNMSLAERAQECRKWLDRILDEHERAKIVESAWRSSVNKELQVEFELNKEVQSSAETQAKLVSELNEIQAKLESELNKEVQDHAEMQAKHVSELNKIQALNSELESELTKMQALNGKLESELNKQVEAHAGMQTKLVSELNEIQARLECELSREFHAHAEIEAELERVLNSISWRITKPLRKASAVVRSRFRGALVAATGGLGTRTSIFAYGIATVGLAMVIFGASNFLVLNNAGLMVKVALTDHAIAFEMIGGGLGLIGLAQALRLVLEINVRG